jgi:NTP pyrophosphatase (non-canonical NTP hydrolase)
LAEKIHKTAVIKGWWKDEKPIEARNNPTSIAVKLALVMTEVSEAIQKARDGGDNEEIAEEIIDGIIRSFDLCKAMDVDIGKVFVRKMIYNSKRPYRHGKLF